jgi:hypothetical protein
LTLLSLALRNRGACFAATLALAVALSSTASAQGGAPLSTEDTNTTPSGTWEINLIGSLARMPGATDILAPDLDVNYGLGDRLQVKAEVPWVTVREESAAAKAGVGRASAGIKWRVAGEGGADGSIALFPQYAWTLTRSSARRGIAEGHQWVLPVIASIHVGRLPLAADAGPTWGADGNGWAAGIVAGIACRAPVECGAEIRQTRVQHRHATLLNAGLRWKIDDSVSLLAAIGHEFGTSEERRRLLGYIALQLRR